MGKRKEEAEDLMPNLATDREEGLARQFDDLAVADLMPDISLASPSGEEPGLVAETAAAVHELMLDASASSPDLASGLDLPVDLPGLSLQGSPEDANELFSRQRDDVSHLTSRALMAGRLFDLVNTELPFQQLVESTLLILMESTQAEAGSILELDHPKAEFFFRATIGGGDPEKLRAFRVPANKGIVGHVVECQEPILLRNMETDEKQLKAISLSAGFDAKTCMAAPILVQGQIYGAIEVFNKAGDQSFDETDLQLLDEGVRRIGKVLEVRFLMAELARRAG